MAIYEIIGKGSCFIDPWNANGSGTKGFQIKDKCVVERIGRTGYLTETRAFREPIEDLYWTKSGQVFALTKSGRFEYIGILTPDPTINRKVTKVEILSNQEIAQRKKTEEKKLKRSTSSKKTALWKWPFKIIWWCIKGVFATILFGAFLNIMGGNKNK